jgi:hypothetical protein
MWDKLRKWLKIPMTIIVARTQAVSIVSQIRVRPEKYGQILKGDGIIEGVEIKISEKKVAVSRKDLPIVTGPVACKITSCHSPVQRSRTPGIQSQPSERSNVGPSRHSLPPLSPAPNLTDCLLGIPGSGGGATITAKTRWRLPAAVD